MWLALAVVSLLAMVSYNLVSKYALLQKEDYDPMAYFFVLFLLVALLSFSLYVLTGSNISDISKILDSQNRVTLIVATFAYAIAPSLYYRALKYIDVSEAAVLYSFVGVFVLIFGISTGSEIFSPQGLLGGILIVLSSIILYARLKGFKVSCYALVMLFSTVFYGVAYLCDSRIIRTGISPLFYQTFIFTIPPLVMIVMNFRSLRRLQVIIRNAGMWKIVIPNAVFLFISYLAIYNSYAHGGKASSVTMIISTDVVLTVLLSTIFLKEKNNLVKKVIASLVALAGVLLLT